MLAATLALTALLAGALLSPPNASSANPPMVAAAGDIACDPQSRFFNDGGGRRGNCRQYATSELLRGADTVLTLGDNQYKHTSLRNFRRSYELSSGRFKRRTRPAIGNHEYGPGVECSPFDAPPTSGRAATSGTSGSRPGRAIVRTTPSTSATGT
jgi:hypothetical protein